MTDFAYDTYDISTIKVQMEILRSAEEQGFWMGLALGSPLGVWLISRPQIQQKFVAGPGSKLFSALFVGSLMYLFPHIVMVSVSSAHVKSTTQLQPN